MMNLNNVDGLIDLETWQMGLKQLPDLSRFHAQSIAHIFDELPKYQDLPQDAIMTLMCGDVSRFDEVFAFYQECAKRHLAVEVYLPAKLKSSWLTYIASKKCFISPIDEITIVDKTSRWLYVDLLSHLSTRIVIAEVYPWINQMNAQSIPVISIDLPAGLDASQGFAFIENPVHADLVFSRGAFFQGLFTGVAKAYIEQAILLDDHFGLHFLYQSFLLNQAQIYSMMPKKLAFAFKGMYERVLIIAGEKDMFGASLLAARAALITGSGWVEVFYQQGLTPPFGSLPEIIWHEVQDANQILAFIEPHDILVLGPGLGEGAWGQSVWLALSDLENRMVLDASALHYMAKKNRQWQNCIISPHPGEAVMLLQTTSKDIQTKRFDVIKTLYQRFAAEVVLKGSGSLIYTKEHRLYVCPHGNAAMATQGMGDVLTGLIAGLWARLGQSSPALIVAVWLHAKAADVLLQNNPDMISIRASQVLDEIENHMQDVLCK